VPRIVALVSARLHAIACAIVLAWAMHRAMNRAMPVFNVSPSSLLKIMP